VGEREGDNDSAFFEGSWGGRIGRRGKRRAGVGTYHDSVVSCSRMLRGREVAEENRKQEEEE